MSGCNYTTQEGHDIYQQDISQNQQNNLEPPHPPLTQHLPPPTPTQKLGNFRVDYSPAELACMLEAVYEILPIGQEKWAQVITRHSA